MGIAQIKLQGTLQRGKISPSPAHLMSRIDLACCRQIEWIFPVMINFVFAGINNVNLTVQ